MIQGILKLTGRTIYYYKKSILYQIIIVALLSAVITGSLLTGRSVKTSLRKSASERLGNTGILISTGVRYTNGSLAERLKTVYNIDCTAILEMKGSVQNLSSQKGAFNAHIYAVNHDFFKFHGVDTIDIKKGEIAINKRLADYLGVKTGDELILRFNNISNIPADAPFAPAKGSESSIVIKIGTVLNTSDICNFSLSISQIMPMNIFMNLSDIPGLTDNSLKINRLLINKNNNFSLDEIYKRLKQTLEPDDIGLSFRMVKKTGQIELISDRIFIDITVLSEVEDAVPFSAPVITYLANRIKTETRSTPYSFVSALPSSLYPEIRNAKGLFINKWLADDINVYKRDSVEMFWYTVDSLNKLIEKSKKLIINGIVGMNGIWADSLLMPEFPGISGSESCSGWDAGVPVKINEIRRKDEDYWNKFRGTPKAFITYDIGKEIWGNNFGSATSIRFPVGISLKDINDKLVGMIDPDKSGFTLSDLSTDSIKAAEESVDFSTLFLSLGFFMILSSVVLLSLVVTSYLNSKKYQIKVFFALGFKNRMIKQLLFLESGSIALSGCLIGAFAGSLVNILITKALNTVWRGAVQTNTLEAFLNLKPIAAGFAISILITTAFMGVKISRYIRLLNRHQEDSGATFSPKRNFALPIIFSIITFALFAFSIVFKENEVTFCFASGTVMMVTFILFWRNFYLGRKNPVAENKKIRRNLYYSFYPSEAVTPILFIAAGIFAVFITGTNRISFDETHQKRSDGTGGYLLWCETTIPVKEDLNSVSGKLNYGLTDDQLKEMSFVQAKRSSGDDASCLNLNHVKAPSILGIDPSVFISNGSFSFSVIAPGKKGENEWEYLNKTSGNNIIYGIADQTVLQWGLKIKPGDTLTIKAENGQPLNIIIIAGMKSSVFQGNVLIGMNNFIKYYPSVSGYSIMIVDGDPGLAGFYKSALDERFSNFGINIELTTDRLASFYSVTNTYLSVFEFFGALGMITGIAGLGFVLMRNYVKRKKEFALMLATGFTIRNIRSLIISEQVLVLFAGVTSGIISAMVATLPTIKNSSDIPWLFLSIRVVGIIVSGLTALVLSMKSVNNYSLVATLKKE